MEDFEREMKIQDIEDALQACEELKTRLTWVKSNLEKKSGLAVDLLHSVRYAVENVTRTWARFMYTIGGK